MKLKDLRDKKILVVGLGQEGTSSLAFFRKTFPKKIIGAADTLERKKLSAKTRKALRGDKKIKTYLGKNYLEAAADYDVIVRSPGIHPKKIKPFLKKGAVITSQTNIFFSNCPGKIIGVTGTKGKSTTSSLINRILVENRIKSHLVGNIGEAALNMLPSAKPGQVFVYELSSHQLLDIKKSPYVAVFLNVFREHMDYYVNFKEYVDAKANITLYQGKNDFLVFNSKDSIVKKIAAKSKAKKIPFESIKVKKFKTHLKGRFNQINIKAAISAAKIFGIKEKDAIEAIKDFEPLPHRLEYVGNFKGIDFYNDALSTLPETTIAAINALDGNVETIMLGGFDRKYNFKKLAKKILASNIKIIILFPTTGKKIFQEILRQDTGKFFGIPLPFFVKDMEKAVKIAYELTNKGKICLLSTASPSFSIFKNYKEKGDLFKKYVKRYGHAK